jgi:IMP dehydrogenase
MEHNMTPILDDKEMSVFSKKITLNALTFDDVLLLPNYSEVLPHEVEVKSYLTAKIKLQSPIISAAMDTVTEHKLAIAMARLGGLGIIHKNLPPEVQAEEVKLVKRSESGVVTNPITITPDDTIHSAKTLMANKKISGLPVTENGKLVGLVTGRDIHFETQENKKIKEIMTERSKLIVIHKKQNASSLENNLLY